MSSFTKRPQLDKAHKIINKLKIHFIRARIFEVFQHEGKITMSSQKAQQNRSDSPSQVSTQITLQDCLVIGFLKARNPSAASAFNIWRPATTRAAVVDMIAEALEISETDEDFLGVQDDEDMQ